MKGEVSGGSKASGKGFLICYDQDTLYTCMNLSKDKLKRLQKKVTQNMSRPCHPYKTERPGHLHHKAPSWRILWKNPREISFHNWMIKTQSRVRLEALGGWEQTLRPPLHPQSTAARGTPQLHNNDSCAASLWRLPAMLAHARDVPDLGAVREWRNKTDRRTHGHWEKLGSGGLASLMEKWKHPGSLLYKAEQGGLITSDSWTRRGLLHTEKQGGRGYGM